MTNRPINPDHHFVSGMSVRALADAAGITIDRARAYCNARTLEGVLYRSGQGHSATYYRRSDVPAETLPAPATMRPLRKAFAACPIPVRDGGRVAPINLQRDYV